MAKIGFFALVLIVFFSAADRAFAEDKDCECPQVTCGPCQKKVSVGKEVKFCSWGNINVCKKYVCENVSYYFGCLSKLKDQKTTEPDDSGPKEDIVLDYEQKESARKTKKFERNITEINLDEEEQDRPIDFNPEGLIPAENESLVKEGFERSEKIVGKISKNDTGLFHVHYRIKREMVKSTQVYVGDELINEAEKAKTLEMEFGKNQTAKIKLGPRSKITVLDPWSISGHFQPFFNLVFGEAEINADFTDGSLDILAGQVIGRLQNGESLIKYEMVDKHLKVKFESLKGKIKIIRAGNLSDPGVEVNAGSYLSWYTDTPMGQTDEEKAKFLNDPGVVTPVFAMSEDKRRELGLLKEKASVQFKDWVRPENANDSNSLEMRGPASADGDEPLPAICKAPEGEFQQCAWACEGNPASAGECMAQEQGTFCVRRVCNADGEWGQPTPFASSYRDLCPAKGVRVGSCRP